METLIPSVSCPSCKLPVLSEFYYCPNCGKQQRAKPIEVSAGKQVGVYLLGFFMPPLAIPFALRYIKQPNKKTRIIGMAVLSLVIVSIGLSLYGYVLFLQQFYSLYTQLNSTQTFGY